ncbi:hypothetical protein AAH979_37300 [Plantactinospora sp. ZYX-F-223]|uniref:hypothetical protein n=1 Tax=Plantactinospora sp. ZYX-F-223 TaxID=3144103 RepID=UPI0031FDFC0A
MADAVVVPGLWFGPAAPLLMYAGDVAERRGAAVHRHSWSQEPPELSDPQVERWVCGEVTPLLDAVSGSLDMTLRYAKIANRTVADEYFAVTEKVEALYQQGKPLPADTIGPRMACLRREHHRLLGNGYCTRPPELDCAFEAICETCT